jgi:hypothetical protein
MSPTDRKVTRSAQRAERRRRFYETKTARARTPWQRMTAGWDQFRRLAGDLPDEFRDEVADRMTTHLNQEIWKLERRGSRDAV